MADSIDVQVQQENAGQESVTATNAVQTRSEIIDISDDDEGNSNGKRDHHIHGLDLANVLQNWSS